MGTGLVPSTCRLCVRLHHLCKGKLLSLGSPFQGEAPAWLCRNAPAVS